MRNKKFPGKLAHTLATLLTLLLTVMLTLGCLIWQADRVLTDAKLHSTVAMDNRVITAQTERIRSDVEEIAQAHPFQVETVMDLVSADAIKAYNSEVIAWWMGLFQADPETEAPAFDTADIEKAVREDPVFQENTPSTHRRTVARDDIAYEVGRSVTRAVMPVRADILSILLPKVLEKVDVPTYIHYLSLLPMLCGIAAGVLALLVVLTMLKRVSKAALYVGAGMAASGLCVVGIGVMVYLIGLPGMIAEISPLLAMQVSLLTKQIALQAALYAAIALVVGLALIALHQAAMKRVGQSWRSMNA